MTASSEHVEDNVGLIRQGTGALAAMGAEAYAGPGGGSGGGGGGASPVGVHFRHVLDHYRAFIDGLDSGRINYDDRRRDQRVERDIEWATRVADELIQSLEAIPTGTMDRPLLVSANVIRDGQSALDWTGSTVQRELMYLLSHSVHHYAIISLLARQAGIYLDPEFGVAPSTLAYRRKACAPSAG